MKQPRAKATRRTVRYGVLVVALVAATVGGLSNSSAAPSDGPITRDQVAAANGQTNVSPAASPGPSLPIASDYSDSGASGLSPTMKSNKAKLVVKLDVTLAALYVFSNAEHDKTQGFVKAIPARQPPCATAADPAIDSYITVDSYAVSTAPGARPYGAFPATKVSMLAFGSIPVTATVHLNQLVSNNKIQPIKVVQYFANQSPACDPNWSNEVPAATNIVRGNVNLSISDVTVDQVPLNVGSNCHTATPVYLNLWGDQTYFYAGGGTLVQQANATKVNGYVLHPDSTDLTIPPFTGCNNAGDDVSRLITAMISGPGNELKVAQGVAKLGGFDPNDPTACYYDVNNNLVCPLPAPPYPTFP